jgi:hypothetical protein
MSIRPPKDTGLSRREKCVLYPGAGVLLIAILLFSILGTLAMLNGKTESAATYAQFVGGFGTIGLILLTGWYSYHTRRMVDQQWQMHKEEVEDRRERRQNEVNALRRALKEEIGKIGYLDKLAVDYNRSHSRLGTIVPKDVYNSNGHKLGLLSEGEVDVVVEYYTRAREVENLMEIQREEHTTAGTDRLMEIFYISENLLDKALKIVTLGYYTPNWEKTEESIQEEFEKLSKAQKQAISELEEKLEKYS